MEFLWPWMLYSWAIIPLLVAAYVVILRRRKKFAVRYSSVALIKDAAGRSPGWRRHIPPFIFLLAIAVMITGLGRPFSIVTLPAQEGVVILAIDVSGSMRAQDVQPSRIEAAKSAAIDFINKQDPTTRVGVVAFSGNAALVQPPTTDHDSAVQAVSRLTLGPRTGIGNAILTSVEAVYEMLDNVGDPPPTHAPGASNPSARVGPTPTPMPVPPGYHVPGIVVLLTDGQSNAGISPLDAAQIAADRGVRVFTIGVGTTEGTTIGGGGFGGGGFGFRTYLDDKTLKEVSRVTDARYFYAKTETDLHEIYNSLNTQMILRTRRMEITFAFAAGAIVLLLFGMTLSMRWFSRLV
jgi:Ca-activated chloride channel homolog